MIHRIRPNGQCPYCGWWIVKTRRDGHQIHGTLLAKGGQTVIICGRDSCKKEVLIPPGFRALTKNGVVLLRFRREKQKL